MSSPFPKPAEFTVKLGEYLRAKTLQDESLSFRLFSSQPFETRRARALLPIDEDAIAALEEEGEPSFDRTVLLDGRRQLFYAEPVRMTAASCVDYHNAHAVSPKKDWKIGDVRGVRVVYLPLGSTDAFVGASQLRLGLLPFAIFLVGALSLILTAMSIGRRHRRRIVQASLRVRASRAKDLSIARLSHELRNPINLVEGFAELVQHEVPGRSNGPVQKYLSSILAAGRHLLLLVNDILDSQKVEAGALEVHLRDCPLRPFVDGVLEMMSLAAGQHGIGLTEDVIAERAVVDPRLFKQVLVNLLSNSIKCAKPNGSVHLSIGSGSQNDLRVAVEDDGPGMSLEEIERALIPYFRVHDKDHPSIEGTGLGLPLCKSMVEAMGGRFTVPSEKGVGTRVEFLLPLVPKQDGGQRLHGDLAAAGEAV